MWYACRLDTQRKRMQRSWRSRVGSASLGRALHSCFLGIHVVLLRLFQSPHNVANRGGRTAQVVRMQARHPKETHAEELEEEGWFSVVVSRSALIFLGIQSACFRLFLPLA